MTWQTRPLQARIWMITRRWTVLEWVERWGSLGRSSRRKNKRRAEGGGYSATPNNQTVDLMKRQRWWWRGGVQLTLHPSVTWNKQGKNKTLLIFRLFFFFYHYMSPCNQTYQTNSELYPLDSMNTIERSEALYDPDAATTESWKCTVSLIGNRKIEKKSASLFWCLRVTQIYGTQGSNCPTKVADDSSHYWCGLSISLR